MTPDVPTYADKPKPWKGCVFCGGGPVRKTEEHVVPRWLIELAGDPKRLAFLGTPGSDHRCLPFDQFVFPACKKCNERFAQLEALAKPAVEKLLECRMLTPMDATTLLDWADKLRIGLWLGGLMLTRNWLGVEPRFAIRQRMGSADRLLYIGHGKMCQRGITFQYIGDPVFVLRPSFQSFYINGVAIVTVSDLGVAAKALGLPYPVLHEHIWDGSVYRGQTCEFRKGGRGNYGRGFPAVHQGFSILAQSIISRTVCGGSPAVWAELVTAGLVSTKPSPVHLFLHPPAGVRLEAQSQVLPDPFESFDSLVHALGRLVADIRRYLVHGLPLPEEGKPLTMAGLVSLMERRMPYSTFMFRDLLPELAAYYVGGREWGDLDERLAGAVEGFRQLLRKRSPAIASTRRLAVERDAPRTE